MSGSATLEPTGCTPPGVLASAATSASSASTMACAATSTCSCVSGWSAAAGSPLPRRRRRAAWTAAAAARKCGTVERAVSAIKANLRIHGKISGATGRKFGMQLEITKQLLLAHQIAASAAL